MGFFNKAATVIANSSYTSMGVTGGLLGGAYGGMSNDGSFLGGALGGAAMGLGAKWGVPKARMAYGRNIRASGIAKGFGAGKAKQYGPVMQANRAVNRTASTGPKGATMRSNKGFSAMSTGAGRAAMPNKSSFRQGSMSGMRTGSQGLNFANPWTPTVRPGQIAI